MADENTKGIRGRNPGLEALVGEWSMQASFPSGPPTAARARATFEWLAGGPFLV